MLEISLKRFKVLEKSLRLTFCHCCYFWRLAYFVWKGLGQKFRISWSC